MKLILFFCINIMFADVLSDWIESNRNILDSKSYKMSCMQTTQIEIGSSPLVDKNMLEFIYLEDHIWFEDSQKIVIINQDSVKMLNKYSNQIFIDQTDGFYNMLLSIDIKDLLLSAKPSEELHSYYIVDAFNLGGLNSTYQFSLFFSGEYLEKIHFSQDEYSFDFTNIKLDQIDDTIKVDRFLDIGNDFSEIFDLRVK